jgi:hypothetical protein
MQSGRNVLTFEVHTTTTTTTTTIFKPEECGKQE